MEEKEQEVVDARWLRRFRYACIVLIVLLGLHLLSSYTYPKVTKVEKLTYDQAVLYKIGKDTLIQEGPCKIVKTSITLGEGGSDSLYLDFNGKPLSVYKILGVNPNKTYQLIVENKYGDKVTFNRTMGDSAMVIVEKPNFIILSKGSECITIKDL